MTFAYVEDEEFVRNCSCPPRLEVVGLTRTNLVPLSLCP